MNLRRLALLVNMFLGALILWVAADIVLTWVSSPEGNDRPSIPENKKTGATGILTQQPKRLASFQSIVAQNVFKTSGAEARSGSEKRIEEIESTKLNLKLKGTVLGENGSSYAIIEDGKDRVQDLYYLNSFVQGAQIVKILADRVILKFEGRDEALIMSDESGPPAASKETPTRSAPQRPVPQRRIVRKPPAVRQPPPPPQPGPQESGEADTEDAEEQGEDEEPEKESSG